MQVQTHPEAPSRFPAGLTVNGELSSQHDIYIDGTFEGVISIPEQHLMVAASARVKARVIARAVTIAGRFEGNVTATQRVRIESSASVQGHIQTPSVELADGARFNGSIDPNRTEAAMLVAKYRQSQAEGGREQGSGIRDQGSGNREQGIREIGNRE
ncbi:MAG TPA: polymer-forming cytoskeletal protein [Vicinamibacterales bacterium]